MPPTTLRSGGPTGCSGEALSDKGPVFITFDVSPGDDGPGILLGFADSAQFDPLPADRRRDRALAGFATLFGDEALNPDRLRRPLLGHRAIRAGWSDGGGAARLVDDVGPWLRKPVGGIHWAGTETADEWTGFLDGAVRSGQRAADEVARDLLPARSMARRGPRAPTRPASAAAC